MKQRVEETDKEIVELKRAVAEAEARVRAAETEVRGTPMSEPSATRSKELLFASVSHPSFMTGAVSGPCGIHKTLAFSPAVSNAFSRASSTESTG